MRKVTVYLMLSLFLAWRSQGADFSFTKDKSLDQKIDLKRLAEGHFYQYGIFFYETETDAQVRNFLSHPLLQLDIIGQKDRLNRQLSTATEPVIDRDRVGKVLIARSAFYLPLPIDKIPELRLNEFGTLQKLFGFVIDRLDGRSATVTQKLALQQVSSDLEVELIDIESNPELKSLLVPVENIAPKYELRLRATNFSALFTASQSTSFLAPFGQGTLVLSYQLASIRERPAKKYRGLLERGVSFAVKDNLLRLIEGLYQMAPKSNFPRSGRGPSSDVSPSPFIDPQGDERLLALMEKVPKRIKEYFEAGREQVIYPPREWALTDPLAGEGWKPLTDFSKPSLQGRQASIKVNELTQAFVRVIQEESDLGLRPSIGQIHQWAPETIQKYRGKSFSILFSKLLIALSIGHSFDFLNTGREMALYQWLLKQPYSSIELHHLFRESYRLNSGELYLSLLTIENLLSANWTYEHRNYLPLTSRLKPITSGYNYDKDRFGTWYHFFGTMTYGFAYGGMRIGLISRLEALMARLVGFDNVQKRHLNLAGGKVGAALRKALDKGKWQSMEVGLQNVDDYLDFSEDFRDRLDFQSSQLLQAWLSGPRQESFDTLNLRTINGGLSNCSVEIIPAQFSKYDSSKTERQDNVTISEKAKLLFFRQPAKKVRVFVSGCAEFLKDQVEFLEAN